MISIYILILDMLQVQSTAFSWSTRFIVDTNRDYGHGMRYGKERHKEPQKSGEESCNQLESGWKVSSELPCLFQVLPKCNPLFLHRNVGSVI